MRWNVRLLFSLVCFEMCHEVLQVETDSVRNYRVIGENGVGEEVQPNGDNNSALLRTSAAIYAMRSDDAYVYFVLHLNGLASA